MKVKYDKETDILYIHSADLEVIESDQDKKGAILDYSSDGRLVGIEILNASKSAIELSDVEYEIA